MTEHDVKDWKHCSNCEKCRAKRWELHQPPGWVAGVGDTHPEAYKKHQSKKFETDMHSYREARRAGLQPDMVSKQAVEKAEKKAYLEERIMKKVS